MKRWIFLLLWLCNLSSTAWGQEWALDSFPLPVVVQPGEELHIALTGPPNKQAVLELEREEGGRHQRPSSALKLRDDGRYLAILSAPQSPGTYRLVVRTASRERELGSIEVTADERTFTATDTVVTRQGPNSDFDRLTPLVQGAVVPIDGSRGDWHRSSATGAWLDGRSGTVTSERVSPPRLTRVLVDKMANGDAELKLLCGSIPETSVVHNTDGRLTITLAGTEHMVFDIKKPSDAANFLGPITVRPSTNPIQTVIEIDTGERGIGGYQLQAGTEPGALLVTVRQPVAKALSDLTITLDAGHGGPSDSGTVGHGGLPEKVLNLRVTEALARLLRDRGAKVIMTRSDDSDVANDEQGAGNELQARVDLSMAQQADLYLSLHHNARPDVEQGKGYHGTDIYWYQPVSEALARALADPIADAIGEPLRSSRYRSFHVIRQTFSPAVLIEFQYLSNPVLEADLLSRADYPEKAAQGVLDGLERYLHGLP